MGNYFHIPNKAYDLLTISELLHTLECDLELERVHEARRVIENFHINNID